MLAKRLPILLAFAGGCLSGGVAIAFFHADAEKVQASAQLGAVAHASEILAAAPAARSAAPERTFAEDSAEAEAPSPAPQNGEPPAKKSTEEVAAEPAAESGTPIADVLSRLEAAYRQGRVPAAPTEAPASSGEGRALASTDALPVAAEHASAPVQATTLLATAPAREAPAPVQTAVALANTPVPQLNAPQAALAAVAPQPLATPAAPPLAPHAGAPLPPVNVNVGDVQQNVYLGNVYQGAVYQYQMQQLAMLEYMQLMALSPYARVAAPGRGAYRGSVPVQHTTPFTTTLTNPDNPWGYDFPPPNLVH